MFNLYNDIRKNPGHFRQLHCDEKLITVYNCPLEHKLEDTWSHYNYIVYVVEGRKTWHTADGSYDLKKGSCVFIRKGACIVEQFFEITFCFVLFFLPDEFIADVLRNRSVPLRKPDRQFGTVMPIENSVPVQSFFQSMTPFFDSGRQPDKALLELKFRELILTLAENSANTELLAYFCALLKQPGAITLRQVMEENFRYNLKLEEYARLCAKSLSAFKRDFQKAYDTTPGKWLLEKRLQHARYLLQHLHQTVSEAAFNSGFENPSHFSRAFKQQFGMTPAETRQRASS